MNYWKIKFHAWCRYEEYEESFYEQLEFVAKSEKRPTEKQIIDHFRNKNCILVDDDNGITIMPMSYLSFS